MTCLAVLSDPHITTDPASATTLRAALAVVSVADPPDALVLPGDLAADGEPGAYAVLRAAVDPVAARLGIPVVAVPGNHDDPAALRAGMGATPFTTWIGGLRIVALDSTVPGHHHGELTDAELGRLAGELARPAPAGTIVVLHHPPLRSPVPSVDLLRLRGTDRLAAAVDGSDVRMIVCGHAHHAGAGVLAGIPVWVAPALAHQVDAFPPAGRLRGVAAPAFSRIDTLGETVVATAVPWGGSPVYDVDAAERIAWMHEHLQGPQAPASRRS
jgi:3',5'-cyclic AMP phosphodiesterase CpdA